MNINYSKFIIRKIASLVLIICLIFAGCATANFDKVEKLQASSYKYSCSKSGLIISIDPFIEKDRVKRVFGYDLLSKGILPVLIIFENKKAEDGFILLSKNTTLSIKDWGQRSPLDNPVGNVQTMKEKETAANVQILSFLAAGFVGLIIAAALAPDLSAVQQNIIDNELVDKTVYPGCSHNGFLYLKLEKVEDIDHIEGVILNVKNVRSNEVQPINVKMK